MKIKEIAFVQENVSVLMLPAIQYNILAPMSTQYFVEI